MRALIRGLALVAVLASGACATTARGPGGGPGDEPAPPPPPSPDRPPDADRAEAALTRLEEAVGGGRYREAAAAADSLYFRTLARDPADPVAAEALWWQGRALYEAGEVRAAADRLRELLRLFPDADLESRAARRLAALQVELAEDPAAVRTLTTRIRDRRSDDLRLLRAAAGSMSVPELSRATAALPEDDPAAGVLGTELAVALARAGRDDSARSVARSAVGLSPAPEDRRRARGVLDGRYAPRTGPLRIGAILPMSGRFRKVGEWLRQGMEVALEAHASRGRGTPTPVELEVVDEASDRPLDALLAELRSRDVMAVVGPVRAQALEKAASLREDPGLLLVSPTASRLERRATATFTLWDRRRREVEPARAAGAWLGQTVGVGRSGVLYPDSELGRAAFLAFRQALSRGDAYVAAAAGYPPEATTFEGPVSRVGAFQPSAVFAAGVNSTSVLQLAPQLSYYGLRGTVVAGGPTWAEPGTLRRLDPSLSQYRVVAGFLDRSDEASPWSTFKTRYEDRYRTLLSNNVLPALGHDAVALILHAVPSPTVGRPRPLGRAFARAAGVELATGRLRPDPVTGTVSRAVQIRRVEDRGLAPVEVADVRFWLERAGGLDDVERRRRRSRALKAVRESETKENGNAEDASSSRSGSEGTQP